MIEVEDGKYLVTDNGKYKLFNPEKDWYPGIVAIKTFDQEGNVKSERTFKKAKTSLMSTLANRQKQLAVKIKNKASKKNRKK